MSMNKCVECFKPRKDKLFTPEMLMLKRPLVCLYCRNQGKDGLKNPDRKKDTKNCLKCEKDFETADGNRICTPCKASKAWISGHDDDHKIVTGGN